MFDLVQSPAPRYRDGSHGGERTLVVPLILCPEFQPGNFALIRRDATGPARLLTLGRAANASPSLNLAQVRHLGATLGANEVHILARASLD